MYERKCAKRYIIAQVKLYKNASLLTKRNNPCTGIKHTTNEHEEGFKELANVGLGKVEKKSSRNNSEFLMFIKISCEDVVKSVSIMEKLLKNVSIKEHDNTHKLDENRNKSESSSTVCRFYSGVNNDVM